MASEKRIKLKLVEHCSFGPSIKTTQLALLSRALCLPRPQPGPGPAKPPAARARLGRMLARSLSAVHRGSTVEHAPRRIKTGVRRPSSNPRLIRLPPFPLSAQQRSSERARAKRGDGAVAGPLVGACAPQRESAPPSSGLGDGALIPTCAAVRSSRNPRSDWCCRRSPCRSRRRAVL